MSKLAAALQIKKKCLSNPQSLKKSRKRKQKHTQQHLQPVNLLLKRKNGKKEIFSVKCQFVEFNVNHEFSYTLQIFLNVQKEACDETIHSLL